MVSKDRGNVYLKNQPELWLAQLPRPQAHHHKYSRGAALVYGGCKLVGAARLSALACARSGAGATTIACDPSVWPIYAQSMWSIMAQAWPSQPQAWRLAIDTLYQAVLVGPGLPPDVLTRDLLVGLLLHLTSQTGGLVLDAGALMAFKEQPALLFSSIEAAVVPVVLTPHEGEFERLFPDLGQNNSALPKADRACLAAERSCATIVLKGNETVIASPQGQVVRQTGSNPYLATAGSGDVLAGIVTGLLAQGVAPFTAACMAVWIHSQAGQLAGVNFIAEDLLSYLSSVWQDLLNS